MSGKTPNISRDTFVAAKRHLSLRMQQGVPIPDAYLNESQDILTETVRNALRAQFGGSIRIGDAFELSESGTNTTNNFTINGVDTGGDPPKVAILDGLMASIFETSWEYEGAENFLHECVATAAPSGTGPTVLTDVHQDFQTPQDDLVNCRVLWTSGALNGSEFVVTAYSNDSVTVSGDSSGASAGDTFKILPPDLTTPGGARTDEVYLVAFWVDVNEEESAEFDATEIVDPALGIEVYHPRRMRVAVRVAENGTTPADSDAGNGVEYRYLHIATLSRTAVATVLTANITNENPAAGNLTAHQTASPIDHPDGSVTLAKLATDSVDASKIVAGGVGTDELAALAVTDAKIANATITESKLAFSIASAADLTTHATDNPLDHPDGSVTEAKLGADSVTNAKIANDAVGNENLAADSVRGVTASGGDSIVQAGSIGSADLSSAADTEAVATANLRSGAVTLPKRGNLTPTAKNPTSNVVAVAAGTGALPAGDSTWAGGDSPIHPVVSGAGQSRKDLVFLDEGGALALLKGLESAGTPVDPPNDGLPTIYQATVDEEVTVAISSGELIDLRGDKAEMLTEASSFIGGLHMDWTSVTQVTFQPGEVVLKGIVNMDDSINTDLHTKGRLRRLTAATAFGISELDEAEAANTFYFIYMFASTSGLTPEVRLSSTVPGDDGYHPTRPWRHVGTVLNDASQDFVPFTKLDRGTTLYRDANMFLDGVGGLNVLNAGSSATFANVDCSAYAPDTARGVLLGVDTSAVTTQWELRVDGSTDVDGFIRQTGPALVWVPINDGGTAGMIEYRVLGASGNISLNVGGYRERF